MNCHDFIEDFLSGLADGELAADEQRLAEDHLGGCPDCRRRLAEEQALKHSIARHLGLVKTPADVRLRIRAALGEMGENLVAARTSRRIRGKSWRRAYREGDRTQWLRDRIYEGQTLAPLALLVVVMFVSIAFLTNRKPPELVNADRTIPAFDFAIAKFNQMSAEFSPNVPAAAFSDQDGAYFAWVQESNPVRHVSDELPDISSSYERAEMPAELCDFAMAGYRLDGGRLDSLPDGRPVTYTLYHDGYNSLLSIGLKEKMSAPEGAVFWFETHALYSYKGYSICLTSYPIGHFVSIIVAREPVVGLLHDVAAADTEYLDR